jgi:hypothetical protein
MPARKHFEVLSVRLPESDFRHFKSVAAGREIPPGPFNGLEGSLADLDIETLMRQEREIELTKDRRWS